MPDVSFVHLRRAFESHLHQINAPARAIIFITRMEIGWTRFQTQAAVNTSQQFVFFVRKDGI
jgi:hypothetical protein